MELWSIALIGFLCGCSLGVITVIVLIRRLMRKSQHLQNFISDLYHKDLLPEVCRIQGLLNLALMEYKLRTAHVEMFLELSIERIKIHRDNIQRTIERYADPDE